MSQAKALALPPASVICAAVRPAESASISNTATLAPSWTNRWQVAVPIPPPPPVTITTFSDNPRMQKFSRALEDIHWPAFVAITVSRGQQTLRAISKSDAYWAKRRHALHHYCGETNNFGIITDFWDRLFGTEYPH